MRIFHVPSHLAYVAKLVAPEFAPAPSPTGRPIPVSGLLAQDPWDYFDVLHLHTVELASADDLTALVDRLGRAGKRLVFTVHDLVPNIESDLPAFEDKTRLLVKSADHVTTLTSTAAAAVLDQYGRRPDVLPHGYAVPPAVARRTTGAGLLAFGALRPNRCLVALVRAWALLPDRPRLSVVLRSVGAADRERSAAELAELDRAAEEYPELSVEVVDRVLSDEELVERCQDASTLVLPYRSITHSGQLELARDLGLGAVLPDVPTLRDQLAGAEHPCVWFPAEALEDPAAFAAYLERASRLPAAPRGPDRVAEHAGLLAGYAAAYGALGE
ncbi:hypothetical protein ACQPXM_40635 [Kribbella sp. CA-253562]|uniref:hypothetical protein n=1 Tax=Kribbella sp. CA-253562 TaxID=3239942 RepID=UPI003D8BD98C